MSVDVLVTTKLHPAYNDAVEKNFRAHHLWQARDKEAMLKQLADKVRGMATVGHIVVDPPFLAKLPKLEMIAVFGVGYDGVDVAACKARGIRVSNTPDVLTDDVADVAISLVLNVLRRFAVSDRFVRAGSWLKGAQPLSENLGGKTVGVLGLGRIGLAIAKRCAAMRMAVVYSGPNEKKGVPYKYYRDLAAMARDCDVLMVACPGGPATRNLVSAQVIDALGKDGYLVNISRGSVVAEPALVKALVEGRLAGAGLDVFVDEPKVPEALLKLDNVVLYPHVGSATVATRKAMADLAYANLEAYFAGKKLPSPVV